MSTLKDRLTKYKESLDKDINRLENIEPSATSNMDLIITLVLREVREEVKEMLEAE